MGKLSREKGAEFERLVADMLKQAFPEARRRAMQSRGGTEGADIDCTPGFWFECGHGKRMDPVAKFKQAAQDEMNSCSACYDGNCHLDPHPESTPVSVTRRDRGEILATMRLTDLLTILAKWRLQ